MCEVNWDGGRDFDNSSYTSASDAKVALGVIGTVVGLGSLAELTILPVSLSS